MQQPVLIAVFHSGGWTNPLNYYSSCLRVQRVFQNLEGEQRIVHLEIYQKLLDRLRQRMYSRKGQTGIAKWRRAGNTHSPVYVKVGKVVVDTSEPFEMVVALADKNKWVVKPIDYSILRNIESSGRVLMPGSPKIEGYFVKNYRERFWAHKMRVRKVSPEEIVVMHPEHMGGFASETGYSLKKVIWINKPSMANTVVFPRANKRDMRSIKWLINRRKKFKIPRLIKS